MVLLAERTPSFSCFRPLGVYSEHSKLLFLAVSHAATGIALCVSGQSTATTKYTSLNDLKMTRDDDSDDKVLASVNKSVKNNI